MSARRCGPARSPTTSTWTPPTARRARARRAVHYRRIVERRRDLFAAVLRRRRGRRRRRRVRHRGEAGRGRLARQRQEDLRLARRRTPTTTACSAPRSREGEKASPPQHALSRDARQGRRASSVVGDWDPLGMRGTVSRTLLFKDVFVPDDAALMPRGVYFQAATRWPHMFLTLSPTYMGLAQAAYDFTVALSARRGAGHAAGEAPHVSDQADRGRRDADQAGADQGDLVPGGHRGRPQSRRKEQVLRAYAAQYTVMEGANDIAALAIRTCGGQAMLKSLPLERIYRDSRCGSLMLPWTAETLPRPHRPRGAVRAGRDGRLSSHGPLRPHRPQRGVRAGQARDPFRGRRRSAMRRSARASPRPRAR